MRLTHFFTYFRNLGGVQSILKRHHREDSIRGHDSRFLFSFEPNTFKEPDISGLGISGWDSIRSIRAKFSCHSASSSSSVAVCHNMWGLQFLADLMPANRRIGLLHSDWSDLQPFLRTQHGLLDGVLCVSNTLVDQVSDCLPELVGSDRIQLIPYPVDGLPEMPNRAPLAKRPVIIGWVGRIQEEQKRVERLPALLKAFDAAKIDYRFELLGDGPRETWLRQQLPSDRTVFHGRQSGDGYYDVLSGWDFITSVSDYEGLPISMLEAFSSGVLPLCPAIGSGGDEYASKLGKEFVWNAFDFDQAAANLKSHLAKPEPALGQARQAARELTGQHSEAEYFRIFDTFVQQISELPRLSEARLAKRPFYFSDQLPFGLMTRLWPSGCFRRNERD
jgi:glycosyltransferase involved in cell wall biosynthesis